MVKFGLLAPSIATIRGIAMREGSTGHNKQKKVGTTNHNNNVVDSSHLHGLEQAIYILEQLCGGKEKSVVIREMHGDKQLVEMWTNFLLHNYWITFDGLAGDWVLTDKGKRWIKQIRKSMQLPHPLSPLQKQQEAERSLNPLKGRASTH